MAPTLLGVLAERDFNAVRPPVLGADLGRRDAPPEHRAVMAIDISPTIGEGVHRTLI
jgi:hypothetical protein